MAVDHGGIDVPMICSATVAQYCFVKGSGSTGDTIAHATAATDAPIGITQEAITYAAGGSNAVNVRVAGTSKLKLGGTVNHGAGIIAGTAGVGMPSTPTSSDYIAARALNYGVSGDIIEVVLNPITKCN